MNKPSRRTAIAAAIGGVALTATAVGAVATTGGTPEPSPEPSVSDAPTPTDDDRTEVDDDSSDGGAPTKSDPSSDSGISREEAIGIAERALAEHGEVPPLDEVERDWEHGRTVWDIEFGDDHEVYVDIETGDVVRVDIDDDRYDDDDDHDDDWDDDRYDD